MQQLALHSNPASPEALLIESVETANRFDPRNAATGGVAVSLDADPGVE
jgi:hypothetical protein